MGLTIKGGVVLAISLFVAVFSIVWPVEYIPHAIKTVIEKTGCPLVSYGVASMQAVTSPWAAGPLMG